MNYRTFTTFAGHHISGTAVTPRKTTLNRHEKHINPNFKLLRQKKRISSAASRGLYAGYHDFITSKANHHLQVFTNTIRAFARTMARLNHYQKIKRKPDGPAEEMKSCGCQPPIGFSHLQCIQRCRGGANYHLYAPGEPATRVIESVTIRYRSTNRSSEIKSRRIFAQGTSLIFCGRRCRIARLGANPLPELPSQLMPDARHRPVTRKPPTIVRLLRQRCWCFPNSGS